MSAGAIHGQVRAEREFRDVMGTFATGVTVVTVGHEGADHGMTANAVMSVSLRPPLVAVAIQNDAATNERIRRAGHFVINVLPAGATDVALRFARPATPAHERFGPEDAERAVTGDTLLACRLSHVACRVESVHEEGDHTLYVGRALDFGERRAEGSPLLFHRGRFESLAGSEATSAAGPSGSTRGKG